MGAVIQQWRKERGWTLGTLSLRAGVNKATLSRWESGKTLPRMDELQRALETLQVPPDDREQCLLLLSTPRALRHLHHKANEEKAAVLPVGPGEMLRALRLRAGQTQGEASQLARVSTALVSRWEREECAPDRDQLQMLCRGLGATRSEAAVLAVSRESRQWQPVALPQERDALDQAVQDLIAFEPTPHLDLTFLSLAGRYHSLWKKGRIAYHEAAGIWGHFADFVTWRHGRIEEGFHLARAALQSLADLPPEEPLTGGHLAACIILPYGETLRGRPDKALAWLNFYENRYTAKQKIMISAFRGDAFFRMGAIAEGMAAYRFAIDRAPDEIMHFIWRQVCAERLSCAGRYEESLRMIVPPSPRETRRSVLDGHWMTYAWALAGIGERDEAERLYQQIRPGIGEDMSPILRAIVDPVERLLDV